MGLVWAGLIAALVVLVIVGGKQGARKAQLRALVIESLGFESAGQLIPTEHGDFPLWNLQFTGYIEPAWKGTLDGRALILGDFWYVGPYGKNTLADRTYLTLVIFTTPVDGLQDHEIWPKSLARMALDVVHGDAKHRTYAEGAIGVQTAGGRVLVFTDRLREPDRIEPFLHAAQATARKLSPRAPS